MADQDDDSWLYGEDGDEMEEVRSDVMNITTVPCACRKQQQIPRLRWLQPTGLGSSRGSSRRRRGRRTGRTSLLWTRRRMVKCSVFIIE